jgi:hypothetical protein
VAEILALMTVFAVLFGFLRGFGASAWLYLFLGTQAVAVCLVQMWFGAVPRGASMLVGSVFLPLWVWGLYVWGSADAPTDFKGTWADLPIVLIFGALLGYCTGALAAGVFLVMDALSGARERGVAGRGARG